MLDGVKVMIGGSEYVCPPAPLGAVRLWMKAQRDTQDGSLERVDAMLGFVLKTLRRNYPDMTAEFLEDNMDGRDMRRVMAAVSEAASMVEVPEGEALPGTSTGMGSTSTS